MSGLDSPPRRGPSASPSFLVWISVLLAIVAGFSLVRYRLTPPSTTGPIQRNKMDQTLLRQAPSGTSSGRPQSLPEEANPNLISTALTSPAVSPSEPPVTPRKSLTPEEEATIATFRRASRSVVYIATSEYAQDRRGFNVAEIPQGSGSGFIWDDQGHIVTNFHVIENAVHARVILADHTQAQATLVGTDRSKDIAVLKIDIPKDKLIPIALGTSSDLVVGQNVLAIGNPFGFDQSLTTGIISGLDREIESRDNRRIHGVIQTDAAINPGNSGGPLLDSGGRLIGVNTAIYSPSGAYAGIGFAIPVDIVNNVVPQLVTYGKTIRPVLGLRMLSSTRELGVDGVLVLEVEPGGTAAAAGIQPTRIQGDSDYQLGDIIVQLDDEEIHTPSDVLDFLNGKKVGDSVQIKVMRGADSRQPRVVILTGKLAGDSENEK